MTKIVFIIFLILITVLGFNILAFSAPHGKPMNQFLIKGSFGYSNLLTQWKDFKNVGYVGGGGGFAYQISLNKNYYISVGAEYLSINSSTKAKQMRFTRDLIDSEGDEFIMAYSLDKYKEIDYTNSVFVPIFIGFQAMGRTSDFYAQVGVKAGYMFSSNYKGAIKSYSTAGYYDRYIDPFENMPNHFFDTEFYNTKNSLDFNPLQLVASIELGVQMPLSERNSVRFGWFLDYGLLNIRQGHNMSSENNLFLFDDHQVNEINTINSLYETSQNTHNITKSFLTGLSVTFMILERQKLVKTCLYPGGNLYKPIKRR